MLRDARSVVDGTTVRTTLCVAGAGVAGVTLAQELIGADTDVLLLESGGPEFTKSLHDLPTVLRRHTREEQRLTGGRNIGQPYYPLRFTRARAVGGSSRAWARHGLQAHPLNAIDLEVRPDFEHSGWPLDMAELEPLYRRAQEVCNLGPFFYGGGGWDGSRFGAALPLDRDRVRTEVFQFGLHSSFDRFLPELAAADNVELMTRANVVRLSSDRAGRITGLTCRTLSGTQFTVEADVFVLAAGAIETARLLMVSDDVQPTGIGNRHDLVGRYFMEHPDLEVGFLLPNDDVGPDDLRLYHSQSVDDDLNIRGMLRCGGPLMRREGLLNSVVRLRPTDRTAIAPAVPAARRLRRSVHYGVPTRALASDVARIAGGVPSTLRHNAAARSGTHDIYGLEMMAEQVPHPDSRIRLGTRTDRLGVPRTLLDWRIQPVDWRSMRRSVELIGEHLADAGVGRVLSTMDADGDTPPVFGNWHHLGTTRMHDDPAEGVVDADGRVHDTANLYITGGSVFPTGGYANPTLTIVALALRLADHLEKELHTTQVL